MVYGDRLAAARARVVLPVRIDPHGRSGPTRGQSQGPDWTRTSRGFYVPVATEETVEQRIAEAAVVLPSVGGVTGWAGLRWAGGTWFDGCSPQGDPLTIDLATCYQDIRSQPGFRVWQERLSPRELELRDGIMITSPIRSLFFAMRYAANVRAAVRVMDLAAYADICSISEAWDYALAHPGWTGVPQVRDALPFADENSWSPRETDLRMIWRADAGLPAPLCNRPIFDRQGRHIGTPDLLDLESGAAGEYNGALHLQGARRSLDSQRAERFRNHGLEPFEIGAPDMSQPWVVAQRMHEARRRARWEAESKRSWTIEAPPWWRQTHTVELRRALDDQARSRLLAHRRLAS
jgi:hypothetical protein